MSDRPIRRKRRTPPNADAVPQPANPAGDPPKVWPEKIVGAKYVRLLEKQLGQLRSSTSHGNQQLFLDDVFVVYLLAFFNPTIRSLRTIEDFSQTQQAQKNLSVDRICKSTLSDFNQLVDPHRLVPILQALRAQLSRKQAGSAPVEHDLQELLRRTIAVDGTFLQAAAEVAWAVANSNNHGVTRHRARLDAHLHVTTWLPEVIVVPDPGQSESDSAIEYLQAGRIYLYDRGYSGFALLRAHYDVPPGLFGEAPVEPVTETSADPTGEVLTAKSHFVVRYKPAGGNAPTLNDVVDQPLTEADRAAGIVSDRVGYFTSEKAGRAGIANIVLREVLVPFEEHGEKKILRLITNLLHVTAKTVTLLYQSRWQVELFFRWFKSIAHFGQLISYSREGMQTHLYVTIIAVLLMYLHTGYRPSKYMFALLSQVAAGAATLEEILPILRERERRTELDRISAALRRAKKKTESV